MKQQIFTLFVLSLLTFNVSAQSFKKATRIGVTLYPQPEVFGETPDDFDINHGWIVIPIHIESERRFLKYFTLGSETTFGWYRYDFETIDSKADIMNLNCELQAKVSIPLFNIFEVFGQYGIGYNANYISSKSSYGDQSYYIGGLSKTIGLGGSIFVTNGFGVSVEGGIFSSKSFKTYNEILDGHEHINGDIPGGEAHVKSNSGYFKINLTFAIN